MNGRDDDGMPPEDPIVVADRDDTQMDLDRIQQLIRELDLTGGVARIFRQKPGAAEYAYEGEVPVDNFSLETIRTVYGGGRYQIKLTAKNGKYVRQLKFSIDPRYVGEMDKPTPTAMTAPTGDNSMFMILLKMQQEQADRMAQQQQQTMQLMMGMMVEGQKATAQMMGAIMGRPERNVTPNQEPASQILGAVMPLVLANMQGAKTTGVTDMLEGLKLMKELATGQTEKEEKEEDVMEKLLRVGGPILQMFMASRQPQQPQVNPVQRVAPVAALPTQDPEVQAAEQKMKQLLSQLRRVTPMLVKAAKKNSSIESYLEILEDHLDDESYAMLQMFLQREDWVTTLFNDDPGVIANIGWFNNFREMVLNPETDESPEPEEASPQDQTPKAGGPTGLVP